MATFRRVARSLIMQFVLTWEEAELQSWGSEDFEENATEREQGNRARVIGERDKWIAGTGACVSEQLYFLNGAWPIFPRHIIISPVTENKSSISMAI